MDVLCSDSIDKWTTEQLLLNHEVECVDMALRIQDELVFF
jgi:hypothetical protein